ncbi:hypothetical protein [Nocardiopsis sp. MG754419]|uniref:hypothetical protein n=1 Tax=Nocardiopsis sp. MG754419 TaxID=2259865 RepID=UPI001BA58F64|nr:hypothetical protein [Nocardiopsis sp. MG754419]MBR8743998.1 hypothetical protein [Nocardiopsis sp. MG754419]
MTGRGGHYLESGAYWLLYVSSVSGGLMHWRLGNEILAAGCVAAAVLSALLIGKGWLTPAAPHR